MPILLFQYKEGLGVEHGNYRGVYIQDNREYEWKPQAERIRTIVGASEWASHWTEGSSVGEKVIPVEKKREHTSQKA